MSVYVTVNILLEGEHILIVECDGDFILFWNLKFKSVLMSSTIMQSLSLAFCCS